MKSKSTLDNEVWKPIKGFNDKYEVSSHGRVRSMRIINAVVNRTREAPLILSTHKSPTYHALMLTPPRKTKTVHSLVLEAFVSERPSGMFGAHLDGNPENNHVSNLKWITPKENTSHRWIHGTMLIGKSLPQTILNEQQVLEIRRRRANGEVLRLLGEEFGVSLYTIYCIDKRKVWKHL